MSLEPALTMGLPLTLLQDNARVKQHAVDVAHDVRVVEVPFQRLGVTLCLAGFRSGEIDAPDSFASPIVCELLAALLHRYSAAGRPVDGLVRFRQRELAEDLGLIESSQRGVPARVFRQIRTALRHLRFTSIVWERSSALRGAALAHGSAAVTELSLLATFNLESELPGRPSRSSAPSTPRSWVRLNVDFLNLLAADDVVAFDFDRQRSLKSRTARVLYRTLAYLSSRGEREIAVDELLERLGSMAARTSRSRLRSLLDGPHAELMAAGVLRDMPTYSTRGDREREVVVEYQWGREAILSNDDAWLIRQCAAFGINRANTVALIARDRAKLLEVVCALHNDDIPSPSAPAGFIVTAVRDGWVLTTRQIPQPAPTRWTGWRVDEPVTREVYEQWYWVQRALGLREKDVPWRSYHDRARTDLLRFEGLERPSDTMLRQRIEDLVRSDLGLPTWEEFAENPKRWSSRPFMSAPVDYSREPAGRRDMRERLARSCR